MKISKTILPLLIAVFASFLIVQPVNAVRVKGGDNIVTEDREVTNFHIIKVNGAFTIYLNQGDECSLRVVAEEDLQPFIKTKMKGEALYITTEKSFHKLGEIKLYIGFKHLKRIHANGAISLKSEHPLRFDELDIGINGASSAKLKLTAHRLSVNNHGASTVFLAGTTHELIIDISGAGNVNALDLIAQEANVNISGVGSGTVYVEEDLRVSISGIGSVKYKGNPRVTSDISFLGTLKKY